MRKAIMRGRGNELELIPLDRYDEKGSRLIRNIRFTQNN